MPVKQKRGTVGGVRGHIRKRSGKRGQSWQVIVTTPPDPQTGRSRQISRTARTKREAEELLGRLLHEVDQGHHGGPDVTVAELLERFFAMAASDWSPKTALETRRFIDNYIGPRLGGTKLRRLTTAGLDDFYSDLRARGGRGGRPLSPATVRRVHVVLRRALGQARRWGWLVSNPAADASPGRVSRAEVSPPDPSGVSRLLALADVDEPELGVFLRLAASTGARRGELCALRWRDVDLDERTVLIARSIVDGPGGYVEKETKTHAARRIALGDSMVAALEAHHARMVELAAACEVLLVEDAHVFSYDPAGRAPWRPDGVTHRFVRLRRQAGLNDVRLHDLRHFAATRMLAGGVSVKTVAGRLGHANASMTLDVYSHFLQASDREAADVLGRVIDSG